MAVCISQSIKYKILNYQFFSFVSEIDATDEKFETIKVFEQFTGSNCKSLVGKPKLFFIQACQVESTNPGASPVVKLSNFLMPNYADFLIFHSTFPGKPLKRIL